MKICRTCKEEKSIEDFYPSSKKNGKTYYKLDCKPCDNRRKISQDMKGKYGIYIEEYETMYEAQEGKCKICGIHSNELTRNLAIDHCHSTGKVRGLLCGKCNIGLGQFDDDVGKLKEAIRYLDEIFPSQ